MSVRLCLGDVFLSSTNLNRSSGKRCVLLVSRAFLSYAWSRITCLWASRCYAFTHDLLIHANTFLALARLFSAPSIFASLFRHLWHLPIVCFFSILRPHVRIGFAVKSEPPQPQKQEDTAALAAHQVLLFSYYRHIEELREALCVAVSEHAVAWRKYREQKKSIYRV